VCYTGGMSDHKRSSPRVLNVADVECHTLDEMSTPVSARMSDISTTGAFLDSMSGLPPGTKLALGFRVGETPVKVAAEVVHTMPNFGMGVRFLDLPGEARAAIEALIREQG
jgi:PilZ domain